ELGRCGSRRRGAHGRGVRDLGRGHGHARARLCDRIHRRGGERDRDRDLVSGARAAWALDRARASVGSGLARVASQHRLNHGDSGITACFIACRCLHALPLRRTLRGLTLAYAVIMLSIIALEVVVPALPFLGAGMLMAQPATRRPPARDRARGYALAALVVGAV